MAAILAGALVSVKQGSGGLYSLVGRQAAARGQRRFTGAQWGKETKKAGMGEGRGTQIWGHPGWGQPLMSSPLPSQQQKSISAMEGVMEALCKSASLFEVTVPDYKQLKACHREVRLLKELWDMIVMVRQARPCGTGLGTLQVAVTERASGYKSAGAALCIFPSLLLPCLPLPRLSPLCFLYLSFFS